MTSVAENIYIDKRTTEWFNNNMSTYTQILYQIVFSTKNREPTLVAPHRADLFKYISGILENKNVISIKSMALKIIYISSHTCT